MIVVTGANGFIGSAIVWELNTQGETDIICVDSVDISERNVLKKRKYKKFLSKEGLWPFLEASSSDSSGIRAIVHIGACSSTTEGDLNFLEENNTLYTNRLFSWCAQYQIPYIYASSAATYGDGQNGFDDNVDPETLKPMNPYGESKIKSDRWALKQKQSPPRWYGLRFFNVFGPNEYHKGEMASVVFKAFHQIKNRGKLQLFKSHRPDYEDGKQKRDFVYVKDVSRWVVELLNSEAQSGIYNMGYGRARTWLDLAQGVFKNMDKPIKIDWCEIPKDIQERYQYYTEAKMEKLQSQGAFEPQWSLEQGIEDYVKNYLTQDESLL